MSLVRNPLLAVIAVPSTTLLAQYDPGAFSGAESPQVHRWDPTHGVLFLRKHFLLNKAGPPPRSYNEDGTQYGADIDLFKDFPDAEKARVSDFAAGPAGPAVLAVSLT